MARFRWSLLLVLAGHFLGFQVASCGQNARATLRLSWADSTGALLTSSVSTSGRPRLLLLGNGLQRLRGADIQISLYSCLHTAIPDAWMGNGTLGCNEANWDFEVGGSGASPPSAFAGIPGLAVLENQERAAPTGVRPYHGAPFMVLRLRAYGTGTRANPGGVELDSLTEYTLWSIQFDLRGKANGGPADCGGDLGHGAGQNVIWFLAYQGIVPFQASLANPEYVPRDGIAIMDGSADIDELVPPVNEHFYEKYNLAWTSQGDGIQAICPTDAVRETSWGRLKEAYR